VAGLDGNDMKGIRNLAKQLNISIGTVSKALNGRHDVNEKTRKRVLAAAAKLGYAPNQSGRSLRQGSTNAVGFMIEFSPEAAANSDNFFVGLVEGAQSALARHALDLVVLPYSTLEDSYTQLQRIVARRLVDALIISATLKVDPRIEYLSRANIPFIALGRSDSGGNHPWIDLDFDGVANVAIDRLVEHGHRRIAVALPDNETNLGYVFLNSYRRALRRHAIPFDRNIVLRGRSSELGGYQIGSQLVELKERPTAILLVYELLAMGLYRRLNEAGLAPGRDIAVIGFREGPQARFLSPTLTCFRMSLHDLGVTLGESLLAALPAFREAYPLGTVHKVWPLHLVPGESDDFYVRPARKHFAGRAAGKP
jgi:DNA-binding LacI/PurR family transcriptional regulator